MTTRYNIVFRGEVHPDKEPDAVKDAFAQAFSLARSKADHIFRRPSTTLKSDLEPEKAGRYKARLNDLGLRVHLVPVDNNGALATPERQPTQPRTDGAAPAVPSGLALVPHARDNPSHQTTTTGGGFSGGGHGGDTGGGRPGDGTRSGHGLGGTTSDNPITSRHSPFRFSGDGGEYFGIWIVNILLSILTLGVYSAWAKVRNKRYFYGNTELDGARFEYTASPKRILFGRAIAALFFILYSVLQMVSPVTALLSGVVLIAFIPWAIRQSLRFNARYSQYRNVPFRFQGTLGGAFVAFIVWPLLGVLTFGALMPMALQRQQGYIVGNHCFGTRSFHFNAPIRGYYKMALLLIAAIAVATIIGGIMMATVFLMVLSPLVFIGIYLLVFAIFNVYMANLKFNHTTIARHGFSANWHSGSYFRLVTVNTLATVFTLGLFTPWARVRSAHYAAAHTDAVITGDLDDFTAAEAERTSTIAEGVGDLFDLDIGI